MVTINRDDFSLARQFNSLLKEQASVETIKKAQENGNKLLKSLNNIDFTSDNSVEGIYYALSTFLSLSILMSKIPLVPKVISNATNNHLNTKVLPKYRNRLLNVYTVKVNDIKNKIDDLKMKIDDDNRGDMLQQIESLEVTKNQLERDCEKIRLVK